MMAVKRIIPTLLLRNGSLVKTRAFESFVYVGDPQNTAKIFNDFAVDELFILDITASIEGHDPDFKLLDEIASHCFMPLAYGGGITSVAQASTILQLGFEKIVIGTSALDRPEFVTELATRFGSQAVVISIDYRRLKNSSRYSVCSTSGTVVKNVSPRTWALEMEARGAGELLLTSIDREGMWAGYDEQTIRDVAEQVSIPVVAHGGASCVDDVENILSIASAAAVGSLVTFHTKDIGVLVNYPFK